MLCLHSCPGWTSHCGTNTLPNRPSITRTTLFFEQNGLASLLSLFPAEPFVPLAALCVCVMYVCVCACVCLHLFIHCTRYLLSAHYVPGSVAEFLWVRLLMPLWLLGGLFLCFFVPKLLPLCQSGCLRFCVFCVYLCPCFSAGPFLCLPLLVSASALSVPTGHTGLCGHLACPWAHQRPDLHRPHLHSLPDSSGQFPRSHF